jgi:hypothetical protein
VSETLSWLIPALTFIGVGIIIGFDIAERRGPSYKWRWKHNCHHGEERKRWASVSLRELKRYGNSVPRVSGKRLTYAELTAKA